MKALFDRKVFTFLVLACICAVSIPLPIGSVDAEKQAASEPFPCQHCPCGCKTAVQCWTSCCCYTLAERIAWAEKNGITPPAYAQPGSLPSTNRQVEAVVQSASTLSHSQSSEPSCRTESKYTTDTLSITPNCKPACCEAKVDRIDPSSTVLQAGKGTPHSLAKKSKRKLIVSLFALKCGGFSNAFMLLPWSILAVIESGSITVRDWGAALEAATPDPAPVFLQPDTPPPR